MEIFQKIAIQNFRKLHSVTLWDTLWKFLDFTATVYSQKFRLINVLLKNFTKNWFDGKKLRGSEFLVFPHCESIRVNFQVLKKQNSEIVKCLRLYKSWFHVNLEPRLNSYYSTLFLKGSTVWKFGNFQPLRCPISMFDFSNSKAHNSETLYFSLHVSKAKMRLRCIHIGTYLNFSAVYWQFSK